MTLSQKTNGKNDSSSKKPRYELKTYRDFIRDAAPYVSLVAGRKISSAEADLLTDEQIKALALLIDDRVSDLNKSRP